MSIRYFGLSVWGGWDQHGSGGALAIIVGLWHQKRGFICHDLHGRGSDVYFMPSHHLKSGPEGGWLEIYSQAEPLFPFPGTSRAPFPLYFVYAVVGVSILCIWRF